ncbi:MAG: tail fiber domain-containing protein, partial [Candidatus Aenigmatarchaeota archaeon]
LGELIVPTPFVIEPVAIVPLPPGSAANRVYVSKGYAYISTGWSDTIYGCTNPDLVIVNVANPYSPTVIGSYTDPNGSYDVKVVGNYAYIASQRCNGSARIAIIDISNPSYPQLVGSYSPGHWHGRSVYISGKYAYFAAGYRGLRIVDISNPMSPKEASVYGMGYAFDVYVSGNYAYVTDRNGQKLHIINVSNPEKPFATAIVSLPNSGKGIYVSKNYAYVAHDAGFSIVDISNAYSPNLLSTFTDCGGINRLFVAGKYAFLAAKSNGVCVVDVSNPSFPTLVTSYDTPGIVMDVFVDGKYIYIADENDKLIIATIKGIETHSLSAYNLSSNNLIVSGNAHIGNDVFVNNGIVVGLGGILSEGGLSIGGISSFGNYVEMKPFRYFNKVFYFNGTAYTDYTSEAYTSYGVPFSILADTDDYFYVGMTSKVFQVIYFDLATPGSGLSLRLEYWNGTSWATTTFSDYTSNLSKDGELSFTPPVDWATTTVNNVSGYWIRLSTLSTPTTSPTAYVVSPSSKNNFAVFSQPGDTSPSFLVTNTGNIGIGTTTPSARLHVYGSTTLGASTSTPINFVGYINSDIIPYSDNTYNLGASSFRWANIYAATTSIGDLVFANQFKITESFTSSSLNSLILLNQNNENILEIDENGNLKVKGEILASSYNVYSSREYKGNIKEFDENIALEKLKNIKFYEYKYKGSSSTQIGIIAEEAPQEILADNGKSINLYKFISFIGSSVKSLANKISNLASSTVNIINYVKDLVVERLTAKSISTENLEILNKIQMKDQITGEIYCLWIENGQIKNTKGKCEDVTIQQNQNINANSYVNQQETNLETSSPSSSNEEQISTEQIDNNTNTTENNLQNNENDISNTTQTSGEQISIEQNESSANDTLSAENSEQE